MKKSLLNTDIWITSCRAFFTDKGRVPFPTFKVEGVGGACLEARIFKSKFLEKLHDFFKIPHLKKQISLHHLLKNCMYSKTFFLRRKGLSKGLSYRQ